MHYQLLLLDFVVLFIQEFYIHNSYHFMFKLRFSKALLDANHRVHITQWAFLGKPFSKPPEASNLIFFAQLTPVCVINALASKNIQLYGPQGPQRALKDPKTGF